MMVSPWPEWTVELDCKDQWGQWFKHTYYVPGGLNASQAIYEAHQRADQGGYVVHMTRHITKGSREATTENDGHLPVKVEAAKQEETTMDATADHGNDFEEAVSVTADDHLISAEPEPEAEHDPWVVEALSVGIINTDTQKFAYVARCEMARTGCSPMGWAQMMERYANEFCEETELSPPSNWAILSAAARVADYYETHVKEG